MRQILCPLCEVDHTAPISRRRARGLAVTTVVCLKCGLVYHNPVLDDTARQSREVSFRQWHTDAAANAGQHRRLTRRWELQRPLIQEVFRPGARILEVGCGLGVVGGRLKEMGAEVVGVEPDPEQAAYAEEQWGLNIHQCPFEDLELLEASFDLILASHVIEHFTDPLGVLVKMRHLGHGDTRLFLETPNILAPKVSPRRLFSLSHNFYFSPRTLEYLLNKAGWQVERLKVWRRDSFQLLARPAPPQNPRPDPQAYQEVVRALKRHRYLYYLKLLFLWRKMPWWRKHWMYTEAPGFKV